MCVEVEILIMIQGTSLHSRRSGFWYTYVEVEILIMIQETSLHSGLLEDLGFGDFV